MLRINKRGDEPVLWVLIGVICFALVAVTVFTYVGSLKDNSLIYKKLYSTDMALTKEMLENTDERTLVLYKIDMFEKTDDVKNPNLNKKLYFDFQTDKISIKEEPIESGLSFTYYDNIHVTNDNKLFDVDKTETVYLEKSETKLDYGKTSNVNDTINAFRLKSIKFNNAEYKNRNIVIFCVNCKENEKAFADGLKEKLSSIFLDKSVGFPIVIETKNQAFYLDKTIKEDILKEYESNSIIVLNANKNNDIIYLDYFSSNLARELRLNMKKNNINYELKEDLMLFDNFEKTSANKGFFLVIDINENIITKKDSFYSAFDFLTKAK